ncbi:MAG: CHAT domain-containing protein [Nostoc sp.]
MNQPNRSKYVDRFSLNIFLILSKINIQEPLELVRRILQWLALVPLAGVLLAEQVQAQSVIPANDGTGTVVAPNGNQINITGGQLSRDNANLFHSFTQFGLNADQIATFLSTPGIQNILGRVVGGAPSIINGQIQVTGSNANLFLMNPAGIVFGANASLNVPGSFTATTANGIAFGSNWFNASGNNNYADLIGNPGIFSFAMSQPGAIFNAGNLTVGTGQNLTLLGGTITNTGSLAAPEGQIIVSAVPGENLVRLSQPGSPLSLEIKPINSSISQANNWNLPILSLPHLLTSGGGLNANKLTVNSDGKVALSGSGISVENGDVVAGNITAETALIEANRNLTGVESQLQTTGDLNLLAGNTVQIRDTVTNPFIAKAGGNLLIQGNQGIDILALNHPDPAFQSSGNLTLMSEGVISGDAHFASGGQFSILNLAGNPGNFISLYDPIIRSNGDVTFGNYTGASLKVESAGNINAGNITINSSDANIPSSDPDATLLTTSTTLILRAGLASVSGSSTFPRTEGGTNFTSASASPEGSIKTGSITTGGITTGDINNYSGSYSGAVILSAKGNIETSDITTAPYSDDSYQYAGDVNIESTNGNIKTGIINAVTFASRGGSVTLNATAGDITTDNITTSGGYFGNAGNINATGRNIQIGNIDATTINSSIDRQSEGQNAIVGLVGGSVKVNATTGSITTGNIDTSYDGYAPAGFSPGYSGGSVDLNAGTTLKTGLINTSSNVTSDLYANPGTSTGGNVTLTAGTIEFTSINTQGVGSYQMNNSTSSPPVVSIGVGGQVSITANGVPDGTVRGTGTVPVPQVSPPSSIPAGTTILTRGNQQSGTINITHNGGANNVPFIVGDSTTNGTIGAIDVGANSRIEPSPNSSFPVLPNGGNASGTPNGITITSVNSPPILTVNPILNGVKQNTLFPFTLANLNLSVSDVDGDNTSLQINAITAGILKKNGVEVVPKTANATITSQDNLEYTPPQGFSGNISPFSIRVGDGVSFSTPQTFGFNVAPTPPQLPPPEVTDQPQKYIPPSVKPEIPIVDVTLPPKLDIAVEGIDDRFATQFENFFAVPPGERRRVTFGETQTILRQIEKATGVKPAIIYISFIHSGIDNKVLSTPQDSDQLDLLIVTSKGDAIHKTISTAKRNDVLNLATNLEAALEDPNNGEDLYLPPAQELYQLLIAPLKEELNKKGINNLLFIADEGLRSLPFAALHDGKQFLVENYSVGFTPALSITDTRYVNIRNLQVLAMGASKFQQLPSLPAVPEELSIVAKDIWKGKFFLNQNFTLKNLKSIRSSQPFGIIHLATHGEFEKGAPDNSFVQFWDNKLKLSQMRDLGLNNPTVELLVLSACRTALGDRDAELGFGGFAYITGVKTALASLWQVSDSGTLALMTEFYKNLKTAPTKSEALRQAQLAMIKGQVTIENGQMRTSVRSVALPPESPESKETKDLKHPFYWSAFTMIGNPW